MDFKIEFDVDPEKAFAEITQGLKNRAFRIAVSKASGIVRAKEQALSPKRLGLLAKSLKIRVRNYQSKNVWVGVIGPKASFEKVKGVYTSGPRKGQPKKHIPANYAHLVEYGHGGPHPAPPHKFIAPAVDSSKDMVASVIIEKMQEVISAALSKRK